MLEFTSDVTDESGNWSPGDLIVVRPYRVDDTDDYASEFWIWADAVEIDYPI